MHLLFIAIFAWLLCSIASLPSADVIITVDAQTIISDRFMGYGVQWDPYDYPPSPDAWQLTIRRLDFMRPSFVRVMDGARTYCLGFDAGGEPQYAFRQGDDIIRNRLGPLLDILGHCQSRHIPVMLGEWNAPRGLGGIDGPGHPRWAAIITDFVHWLRSERGLTCITMYNMVNEPNGGWMWPQRKVDYGAWATGIRNLRLAFDARGLKDLPIVGPDNAWDWDWIDRVAQDMPDHMGAWEMHWYAKDAEVRDGAIERLLADKRQVVLARDPQAQTKRFFLGEAGLVEGKINGDQQPRVATFAYGVFMADLAAQVARAGWHGAVAWDLDDAMHVNRNRTVPPAADTLKVWGFWNTQGRAMGRPADEDIRPWFTPWSLLCRLFPADTRIVAAAADAPGLRAMAGVRDGGRIAIMLVNQSDAPRIVRLHLSGIAVSTLVRHHYFEQDHPRDADGFPMSAGTLAILPDQDPAVVMPGRGVLFLSSPAPAP